MEAVKSIPCVIGNPAVIEAHEPANPGSAIPFRMTLCRGEEPYEAYTWIPPIPANTVWMPKVHVTEVEALTNDFTWCPVVTHIVKTKNAPMLPLISTYNDPLDLVQRLKDVVKTIEAIALVDFINDVFTLREVYRHFWTCPASQDYHHAFPGGLAVHSIEMAERAANTPYASSEDRDFAIVHALLHDIGKILCYGKEGYTTYHDLGHELAGIVLLHEAFAALERRWEDGATGLRSLLAGLRKNKGRYPILAVGKLVQAFDQASVEQDLRKKKGHRRQPWTARPCAAQF